MGCVGLHIYDSNDISVPDKWYRENGLESILTEGFYEVKALVCPSFTRDSNMLTLTSNPSGDTFANGYLERPKKSIIERFVCRSPKDKVVPRFVEQINICGICAGRFKGNFGNQGEEVIWIDDVTSCLCNSSKSSGLRCPRIERFFELTDALSGFDQLIVTFCELANQFLGVDCRVWGMAVH